MTIEQVNSEKFASLTDRQLRKELAGRCRDAVNGTIGDIPPLVDILKEAEERGLEVVPGLADSLTKRLA